jgi:hypothetical protein
VADCRGFVRRKSAPCRTFPVSCAKNPFRAGKNRFVRRFFDSCGRFGVSCGQNPFRAAIFPFVRPKRASCGEFSIRAAKNPVFDAFLEKGLYKNRQFTPASRRHHPYYPMTRTRTPQGRQSDGPNMIPLGEMATVLRSLLKIYEAAK